MVKYDSKAIIKKVSSICSRSATLPQKGLTLKFIRKKKRWPFHNLNKWFEKASCSIGCEMIEKIKMNHITWI